MERFIAVAFKVLDCRIPFVSIWYGEYVSNRRKVPATNDKTTIYRRAYYKL